MLLVTIVECTTERNRSLNREPEDQLIHHYLRSLHNRFQHSEPRGLSLTEVQQTLQVVAAGRDNAEVTGAVWSAAVPEL